MSINFRFKVHAPDGQPVGAAEYGEDAAALVALRGEGGTVRFRNVIVYTQGVDGDAGESYDAAAGLICLRADNVIARRQRKRDDLHRDLANKHAITARVVEPRTGTTSWVSQPGNHVVPRVDPNDPFA